MRCFYLYCDTFLVTMNFIKELPLLKMLICLNNFKSTLIKHPIILNEHYPNRKKSK